VYREQNKTVVPKRTQAASRLSQNGATDCMKKQKAMSHPCLPDPIFSPYAQPRRATA